MLQMEYSQILTKIDNSCFIIIDQVICQLYPDIRDRLENKVVFKLESAEKQKSLSEVAKAIDYLLDHEITRKDTLLAIGGGATSDFAGFVAATTLRGISWEVIPTTLLAMIDASVGGKTGVNTAHGKNLIGAFHLPQNIYFNLEFLKTLPAVELNSGYGELLKYTFLDKKIDDLVLKSATLDEIVFACAQYKQDIVNEDFKESGKRKILNLGHTLGHALEKSLSLPHGIAVAWGLKFIIDIYVVDQREHFNLLCEKLKFQLPKIDSFDFEVFYDYLKSDKKRNLNDSLDLILPLKVGKVEIQSINLQQLRTDLEQNKIFSNYIK